MAFYTQTVLNDAPARFYRLAEASGTIATDSGSQAQNGTYTSVTLAQGSLFANENGTSALFNGSSSQLTMPTTGLPTGSSAWSIEAWIKTPATLPTVWQNIFQFGTFNGAAGAGVKFAIDGSHTVVLSNVNFSTYIGTFTVAASTTYHLVATYDGTTAKVYVNGTLKNSALASFAVVQSTAQTGFDEFSNYLNGTLQDIAVYTTTLSDYRVNAHYRAAFVVADNPYGVNYYNGSAASSATNLAPSPLFGDLKTLGVSWLRVYISWYAIEQTNGVYTWTALDDLIQRCNAAGIRAVFPLADAPTWHLTQRVVQDGQAVSSSNSLPGASDLATFATAVATRYNGTNGHGFIDAFEIGNEEWTNIFGSSFTDAQYARSANWYTAVLQSGSSALRSASPTALVGMTPLWWVQMPQMATYLQALYTAGLGTSFDFANFHYYPQTHYHMANVDPMLYGAPGTGDLGGTTIYPSFAQFWQSLQNVLIANSDTNKKIWVTEAGEQINTNYGRAAELTVSQDVQARQHIVRMESARTSSVVAKYFVYNIDYNNAGTGSDATTSDGTSITQGVPPTESYTQAWTDIKNYITRYPGWSPSMTVVAQDTMLKANVASGMGTASDGSTWTHVVGNGSLSISADEAQLLTSSTNNDYIRLGTAVSSSPNILLRGSVNSTADTLGPVAMMSGSSSSTISGYSLSVNSSGNLILTKIVNGSPTTLASVAVTRTAATLYWHRLVATASVGQTQLSGYFWQKGTVEPSVATLTATDTSSPFTSGGVGVTGFAASSTNPVLFDSFLAQQPIGASFVDVLRVSDGCVTQESFAASESSPVSDTVLINDGFNSSETIAVADVGSTSTLFSTPEALVVTDAFVQSDGFAVVEIQAIADIGTLQQWTVDALAGSDVFTASITAQVTEAQVARETFTAQEGYLQTDALAVADASTLLSQSPGYVVTDVVSAGDAFVSIQVYQALDAQTLIDAFAQSDGYQAIESQLVYDFAVLQQWSIDALMASDVFTGVEASLAADVLLPSDIFVTTDGYQTTDTQPISDTATLALQPSTSMFVDALNAADSFFVVAATIPLDFLVGVDALASSSLSLVSDAQPITDVFTSSDALLAIDGQALSDFGNFQQWSTDALFMSDGLTVSGVYLPVETQLANDVFTAFDLSQQADMLTLSDTNIFSAQSATYFFVDALIATDAYVPLDGYQAVDALTIADASSFSPQKQLTIYGTSVASTTLTTAAQLATATGGVETSKTTTASDTSNLNQYYMEIYGLGGTSGDSATIPAPDGRGFLLDSTLLEGQTLNAGNWSASFRENDATGFAAVTMIIRAYKRSSAGVYTSIGSMQVAGQSMSATTTTYTIANTPFPSMAFDIGDKLYLDHFILPTTGHWAGDPIALFLSNSATAGVANDFQVNAPFYQATLTTTTYSVVEGLTVNDSSASTLTLGAVEPLTVSDVFLQTEAYLSTETQIATDVLLVSDSLSSTEALIASDNSAQAAELTAIEVQPASETFATLEIYQQTEALALIDASSISQSVISTFIDTLSQNDIFASGQSSFAIDAQNSTDTFVQSEGYQPGDAQTINESVILAQTYQQIDALAGTDLFTGSMSYQPVELYTLADAVAESTGLLASDVQTVSAVLTTLDGYQVADVQTVSDAGAFTQQIGGLADALTASDALLLQSGAVFIDVPILIDGFLQTDGYQVADAQGLSDNAAIAQSVLYIFIDALASNDFFSQVTGYQAIDVQGVSDGLASLGAYAIFDQQNANDVLTATGITQNSDALASNDLFSQVMSYQILDVQSTNDVFTQTDSYQPIDTQSVNDILTQSGGYQTLDVIPGSDALLSLVAFTQSDALFAPDGLLATGSVPGWIDALSLFDMFTPVSTLALEEPPIVVIAIGRDGIAMAKGR